MNCNSKCNQGRDCNCMNSVSLTKKEYIGAAIIIIACTILSVLSVIGGAAWIYGTLGDL